MTGPFTASDERAARMALCCVTEPAQPRDLVDVLRHGPVERWEQLLRQGGPQGDRARALDLDRVHRATDRAGARFVTPADEEWPSALEDLHTAGHQGLAGAPLGLWLRGPGWLGAVPERAVAVVGSRAATSYGSEVATNLAYDLAGHRAIVVSGGAFGIDAAAHRGAMAGGGATVAVLAGGIDDVYPRGNAELLERVAREHLVVSELPPGAHPTRVRFLSRNRLIAALAPGLVVVEAGIRSGARNTLGWAEQLGRRVMAVPGPITSTGSATPLQMLRDGATAVGGADHVLEVLAEAGSHLVPPLASEPLRPLDRLEPEQRALFELVPGRGGLTAEALALTSGRALPQTVALLAELDEQGFVVKTDDGRWRLRPGSVG